MDLASLHYGVALIEPTHSCGAANPQPLVHHRGEGRSIISLAFRYNTASSQSPANLPGIASRQRLHSKVFMTLTELKYIVAVARARHFGHAAEACHVAQPTLSVAIKKLEDELGVILFERGGTEISITPLGQKIITQAEHVLEQTAAIKELAQQNKDPLSGPLRLGIIYTIGPYLLPPLVKQMITTLPQMPLILQENFTVRLLEMLRQGELDAAIMALPLPEHGMFMQDLYDEPFVVAMPQHHPWVAHKEIAAADLKSEPMLLLGNGHCFRDHVLEVCPEMARFASNGNGMQRTFEGSSLETIRHMVASGIGLTILPRAAVPNMDVCDGLLQFRPFQAPVPSRRVVMVWRKSFTRKAAIDALCAAVAACDLPGVTGITGAAGVTTA
jgi:LysR family hydrogen peroxide-inducible transcriptional activator